ncbi:MAG TPA: patatin-like phospholipase family protein [Gaiellaceae bacterium]|nr:patatin-like phospholipase family protein [Gaiellaceae bacterium]
MRLEDEPHAALAQDRLEPVRPKRVSRLQFSVRRPESHQTSSISPSDRSCATSVAAEYDRSLGPVEAHHAAARRPSAGRSVFDGVPAEQIGAALDQLSRRRFAAGSTVIAQGDTTNELYVVEEGVADVFVVDSGSVEHHVGSVRAGGTLGEMSLFTGQPAAGTVRAATDLGLLVVHASEFERIASAFPVIYRNLGAILSERLARTNRLAAREGLGQVVFLRDWGAPQLLVYALAASIAWHTRASTLLLVVAEDPEAAALASLLDVELDRGVIRRSGAHVLACSADDLDATVHDLRGSYDSILVHLREEAPGPAVDATLVHAAAKPESARDDRARFTLFPAELDGRAGEPVVGVPGFSEADLEALRDGLLPNSTPAGRSLGRVARALCGLSVGFAFGAGSVRGFAHWGVLRAFERIGLEADYVAGTSVGGSVAALYALGRSTEEGIDALVRTGPHLVRYGIPRKGLLSNRSLRRFLHNEVEDVRIEDLPTPLALVAADILTQQEVVFRSGLVWQAVMASLSIPGVYPALWIGEHLVVDGGVLNPVPVSIAAEMGAGVVVAVKLLGEAAPHREVESVVAKGTPPSALSVILRSIELMQARIVSGAATAHTITIIPGFSSLPGNKLKAFADGGRFVELGEEAAEQAMPRITAALPWLRP